MQSTDRKRGFDDQSRNVSKNLKLGNFEIHQQRYGTHPLFRSHWPQSWEKALAGKLLQLKPFHHKVRFFQRISWRTLKHHLPLNCVQNAACPFHNWNGAIKFCYLKRIFHRAYQGLLVQISRPFHCASHIPVLCAGLKLFFQSLRRRKTAAFSLLSITLVVPHLRTWTALPESTHPLSQAAPPQYFHDLYFS